MIGLFNVGGGSVVFVLVFCCWFVCMGGLRLLVLVWWFVCMVVWFLIVLCLLVLMFADIVDCAVFVAICIFVGCCLLFAFLWRLGCWCLLVVLVGAFRLGGFGYGLL